MKKFKSKTAFLLDMLEYYTTDTNRRCKNGVGCNYSPVNAKKQGISEGCAIGRYMTPENQLIADSYNFTDVGTVYDIKPTLLPKWLVSLNLGFLSSVQILHDTDEAWVSDGLSTDGKELVESIIKEFRLRKKLFEKYLI